MVVTQLSFCCSSKASQNTLVVEPWCHHFTMEKGVKYMLEFTSEVAGHPEIEICSEFVTVYGWTQSLFTLTGPSGLIFEEKIKSP